MAPIPPAPVCSECGKSLAGRSRQSRTCSDRCRTARSQRLRRQFARAEEESAHPNDVATKEMRLAVRSNLQDEVHKVMKDELRPIVREALTEDVLRAISGLLALTPIAVQAIAEDLQQDESYDRRQKAYTLLMKYTAGNSPLVPSVDPAPPAINVHFPGMERPAVEVEVEEEIPVEGEFECNSCGHFYPDEMRAAPGASRCKNCHRALQDRLKQLHG